MALDASMLSEGTSWDHSMEITAAERRDKARKTADFFGVVRTRIFIADDMKRLDVEDDWHRALRDYRRNENDPEQFDAAYKRLMAKILEAATSRSVK